MTDSEDSDPESDPPEGGEPDEEDVLDMFGEGESDESVDRVDAGDEETEPEEGHENAEPSGDGSDGEGDRVAGDDSDAESDEAEPASDDVDGDADVEEPEPESDAGEQDIARAPEESQSDDADAEADEADKEPDLVEAGDEEPESDTDAPEKDADESDEGDGEGEGDSDSEVEPETDDADTEKEDETDSDDADAEEEDGEGGERGGIETVDEDDGDGEIEVVEEDGEIEVDVDSSIEPAKADIEVHEDDDDVDEMTDSLFSMAADKDEEEIEIADDEEFERSITTETQSAEELLETLEMSGALDPEQDTEIDLVDEDLSTDDYTSEYLDSLFPLLSRSAEWVEGHYQTKRFWHPKTAPVVKDLYTWEHFKIEYYYTDYDWDTYEGQQPTAGEGRFADDEAEEETGVIEFKPHEHLGFDPDGIEDVLDVASDNAEDIEETFERNSVNVSDENEDEFFRTQNGNTTVISRYDLEKAVPLPKKQHFEEIERYWVNKPFACVVLFRSEKENEMKYYAVEPHLNPIEENVLDFLIQKLRNTIKYAGEETVKSAEDDIGRAEVIEKETYKLLDRYNIYDRPDEDNSGGLLSGLSDMFSRGGGDATDAINEAGGDSGGGILDSIKGLFSSDGPDVDTDPGSVIQREHVYTPPQDLPALDGIEVRPEPVLIEEDDETLNQYQVEKLLYYLKRDFVGYAKIDPIKRDINVEDISCNGYNRPVFAYHTDYEQIISNIYHGDDDLDEFVVKLAQRSGKGISKRQPQVDCTLPDGSRAQLTLGQEVSDHGTNYTIRQFKDVPFTPVDLICWNTFSLDEMAFLWLCIENHKSLIFAGGTASGKTTSLNAVSLFIPSNTKIVSIEDTREVELPQRNWIASVTRPSFSDDEKGDIDEFDLLEAALRQRPDYIVMGEIRGEEGRTAFQVMSTGHTTYTTFHADSVEEVMKRFTTDPINVSKTLFTALDLVSIQSATRVDGNKVRRNKTLTEVNGYDPENDEINVQDVYEWQAETDNFVKQTGATTLEKIKFDRGWNQEKLDEELFKRKVVLAYLIKNNLNTYVQVGATIQAFMTDPETTLGIIANEDLESSLDDLRSMESVKIDVDPEKEALVPRPTAGEELLTEVDGVLDEAEDSLFSRAAADTDDVDLSAFDESGRDRTYDDSEADSEEAIDLVREEAERAAKREDEGEDVEEPAGALEGTETAGELPAADETADAEPEAEAEPDVMADSPDSTPDDGDTGDGFQSLKDDEGDDDGGGLGDMFGGGGGSSSDPSGVSGGSSIFDDSLDDDPFGETDDLDDLFGEGGGDDDDDDPVSPDEFDFGDDDDDDENSLDDIF